MMITNRITDNIEKKSLGIYIHIPYCLKKCRYCDFLSYTTHTIEAREYYGKKLVEELVGKSKLYNKQYTVDSIFIGGGTPSLMEIDVLESILDAVYSKYHMKKDSEITIEANPGTLTFDKLKGYKNFGINRLSMGAQSLNQETLDYLGRIHSKKEVLDSFYQAREVGFENINTDMMFGIPEQSPKQWNNDLKEIIALKPEHISFYSLQVEEGTQVLCDIIEGRVQETDAIVDREMYHDAVDILKKNGYDHYEISNAALPGYESKHNLKYWSMNDYIGIGLGAHSYVDNKRFGNTEILKDYLSAQDHQQITVGEHKNSKYDQMSEFIFLGLRKTEGISLNDFEKKYGKKFLDLYKQETEDLMERGLLEIKNGNLKLTPLGLDLSNQVFREYV